MNVLSTSGRWFDPITCVGALACSIAFAAWGHATIGSLSAGLILFSLGLPIACIAAGGATLAWLRVPIRASHPLPLAIAVGAFVVAFLLLAADVLVPVGLRASDGIVLAISLIARLAAPRLHRRAASLRRPRWPALVAVGLALAGATLWTESLRPYATRVGDEVVVSPWSDFFIHAQIAAQIHDDKSTPALGDPDLAGRPLPFYHYASYVFPASFEAWAGSNATAMDALAANWVPFGTMLLALAAYALATEWWGEVAGLAALAAVTVVPDSPMYAIPLDWYSFYWLMQVTPANLYGIAGAAVGVLLIAAGTSAERRSLVLIGLVVLGLGVLVKAQIAIVALPLGLAWAILFDRRATRRQRWIVAMLVAVGGLIVLAIMERLHIGPSMLPLSLHYTLPGYLRGNAFQTRSGVWQHVMQYLFADLSLKRLPLQAIGIVLVMIVAPLGGLLLMWATLLLVLRSRGMLRAIDAWPALAFAVCIGISVVVPQNRRGGIDELWHRPFVWFYFVIAVWCWGRLASFLPTRLHRRAWPSVAVAAMATAMLLVPLFQGRTIQIRTSLAAKLTNTRLPAGFVDCARFLRERTSESDVVQDTVESQVPYLSGLSERRAYLGRSPDFWHQFFDGGPTVAESGRRADVLTRLRDAQGEEALRRVDAETSVDWYVAAPGEGSGWPTSRVAFESLGYRVFDLRSTRPLRSAVSDR